MRVESTILLWASRSVQYRRRVRFSCSYSVDTSSGILSMLFVSLVSYVIGSRETAPMQLSAGQINPTFLLFSVYYMAMKNLPRHIQELIANHLDPKSSARLRAVSREMKDVVDARRPPTGSYQRKTGRFQKRFSIKGFEKCKTKHAKHFTGMEDIRHFSHFMGFGHRHYSDLKKAYKRNTLFRDFKSITTDETEDMYWQDSIAIWPHMASDHAFRLEMKSAWRSSIKERRDFRRMVIRLLKLWARETPDGHIHRRGRTKAQGSVRETPDGHIHR